MLRTSSHHVDYVILNDEIFLQKSALNQKTKVLVALSSLNGSSTPSTVVVIVSGTVVATETTTDLSHKKSAKRFASNQPEEVMIFVLYKSCFHSAKTNDQLTLEFYFSVACFLPKIAGPCDGYYPSWYYDPNRRQCLQFIYGGCLGNNNKFQTLQECESLCSQTTHTGIVRSVV